MAQSQPYLVPSMIGGVSEQSAQDRPPSTSEDQANCLNDPLNGCMARPGGVVVGSLAYDMDAPFIHDIRRSDTEHYKVFIERGQMVIVNIITGNQCSISGDIEAYLSHWGTAKNAFTAVTVEDTTFIVNKQTYVAMAADLSPARDNKALFYFKAGAYSTTYKASVRVNDTAYTAEYTTPGNTDPENAKFITTRRLALELRDAFDVLKTSFEPALDDFTFSRQGSTVIVSRSSSEVFKIDTEDGIGDTQLIAVSEWVSKFENLPARAPDSYVVGVRGSKADQKDDYWLQYKGGGTTGYWEEIVKPETPTSLDASTMPHLLLNTAVDTFEVQEAEWNTRISGDGILSAKDPTFIGRKINAINLISGRLALMTEGTFMLSRARNAFCFFPDTAQTRLDTDPVGFEVANGKSTIITQSVAVSGKLFFWGDENQMLLDSGDQPLTEEFADILPSTNYEYDGKYPPVALGRAAVIFGTEVGNSVRLKEVMYRNGQAIGEIPLNDHCPKFISGSLRQVAVGSTAGILVVLTSQEDTAYVYQWLNQGDQRVQTAWNRWTFKSVDRIVTAAIRGGAIYLLMQLGGKLLIERFELDPADLSLRDIRLDHRVAQDDNGYANYQATLTLPYSVPYADWSRYRAIRNEDDRTGLYGGEPLAFTFNSENSVTVDMPEDHMLCKFWFGALPEPAELKLSQLYVQTKAGTLLPDRNLIDKLKISHDATSQYNVVVRDVTTGATVYDHQFNGRQSISTTKVNKNAKTRASEKNFAVDRKSHEVEITLINDTHYPSRWVQAEYSFAASR